MSQVLRTVPFTPELGNVQRYYSHAVMKAFVPVLLFAVITFPMLAVWNEFSGAARDLRSWLYLVRLLSWLAALLVASLLFAPALLRRRLHFGGAVLFATVAVLIYFPCLGFLTAYAEEHVIQQRRVAREPSDLGYTYMYAEFSGSGYSRGALDAVPGIYTGFRNALAGSFIWFPIIFFASRRLYHPVAPPPK